jgi:hypothetical protein
MYFILYQVVGLPEIFPLLIIPRNRNITYQRFFSLCRGKKTIILVVSIPAFVQLPSSFRNLLLQSSNLILKKSAMWTHMFVKIKEKSQPLIRSRVRTAFFLTGETTGEKTTNTGEPSPSLCQCIIIISFPVLEEDIKGWMVLKLTTCLVRVHPPLSSRNASFSCIGCSLLVSGLRWCPMSPEVQVGTKGWQSTLFTLWFFFGDEANSNSSSIVSLWEQGISDCMLKTNLVTGAFRS